MISTFGGNVRPGFTRSIAAATRASTWEANASRPAIGPMRANAWRIASARGSLPRNTRWPNPISRLTRPQFRLQPRIQIRRRLGVIQHVQRGAGRAAMDRAGECAPRAEDGGGQRRTGRGNDPRGEARTRSSRFPPSR